MRRILALVLAVALTATAPWNDAAADQPVTYAIIAEIHDGVPALPCDTVRGTCGDKSLATIDAWCATSADIETWTGVIYPSLYVCEPAVVLR